MNRFTKIAVAAVVLGCTWQGATAMAQELTISGSVTDDKKAVVPGVSVTLRDPSGTPSMQSTTADGEFKFERLKSGPYELSFAREGYQSTTRTLTLTESSRTVDVSLGLGKISTTLEVTDTADLNAATRMYVSDRLVPTQVSVVSQDTLRIQNVNDLATALENASGITTQVQYGVYEWYTINGFTQQSGNEFLFIDGMASTGNRSNTQLTNIESIEVIKGPAALLMGSSGSVGSGSSGAGGIVNVVRKKPESQAKQEAFFRVGRWGLREQGFGTTGRVFGMDKLLYRVDVGGSQRDGWRQNAANRFNISPVLTYIINSRARVTLQEGFTRDRYELDAGIPAALYLTPNFPLDKKLNPPGDFQLSRDWQTQVRFQYQLTEGITFQSQFFTQVKRDQYLDAESMTYRPATNTVDRSELYFGSNIRPKQSYTTITGVNRFLGLKHNWSASYSYQDHHRFQDRRGTAVNTSQNLVIAPLNLNDWLQPGFVDPAVQPTSFPRSRVDYTTATMNVFGLQDHIELGSRLAINLVGQRNHTARRSHNDAWDPATDTFVSRGADSAVRSQSANNYRAGISYAVIQALSLYFNTSSNYSPYTSVPATLDPSLAFEDLKPAINQSISAGEKWVSRGGRLRVGIEASKTLSKNQLVPILNTVTNTTVTVQAGQQSSKTVNMDLEGLLGWGLRATANYGYAACRYDNFSSSATGVNSNFTGRRCQYSNRHTGRTYITKQVRVGRNYMLNLSLGATYRSKTVMTTNAVQSYQGGWVRFDAGVGLDVTNKWSVAMNITNLLNRQRYVVSQINSGGQVYPGQPFAATLTLRYQFNHDKF